MNAGLVTTTVASLLFLMLIPIAQVGFLVLWFLAGLLMAE
jgi:hypothetical protein